MGAVQFTATRSLLVASGTLVDLDVRFSAYDRSFRKVGSSRASLNGTRENIIHRLDSRVAVTIAWYDVAEQPAIDQWLHSVVNGESFTIDPTGSVAVPVAPVTVRMISDTLTEATIVRGAFRQSFNVEV